MYFVTALLSLATAFAATPKISTSAVAAVPTATPVAHPPVAVVINAEGEAGYLSKLSKCSDFKGETKSCLIEFDGELRGQCEVCREGKSCFIALNGKPRALCEAYVEKKSCFMSFEGRADRSWCEHFQEKKSCDQAFGIASTARAEKRRCERGEIPRDHHFWLN